MSKVKSFVTSLSPSQVFWNIVFCLVYLTSLILIYFNPDSNWAQIICTITQFGQVVILVSFLDNNKSGEEVVKSNLWMTFTFIGIFCILCAILIKSVSWIGSNMITPFNDYLDTPRQSKKKGVEKKVIEAEGNSLITQQKK